MSNKTRLQTNNTNLQALIDKANSLPDAGGSGGGGSIETCTLTLRGACPLNGDETVHYINSSLTAQSADFPDMMATNTLTVVKNSFVFFVGSLTLGASGGITRITTISGRLYFISGDATLYSS
jgi:hypothetical protein